MSNIPGSNKRHSPYEKGIAHTGACRKTGGVR